MTRAPSLPDITTAASLLLLTVAVVAGFLVRMPLPDGLEPARFYSDEAWYAWDALRILQGARPLWLEENNGRQVLFAWSMAPVIALFGPTVFAAKLTAALWGTLAIPLAWLLAREVLAGRAWRDLAAGLVAILTAGLTWHLFASLFAVRAITWPALLLLALWLLLRAWRRGGWGWWAAAGLAMGAGLWAYTSAWLVPPLVAAWWLLARGWRQDQTGLPVALLATALAIGPFLVWAIANLALLAERPAQVLVTGGLPEVAGNLAAYLAMLVVPGGGDPNPRHGLPGWPALDLLTATLALTGAVLGWRDRDLRPAVLLALVLAAGLLLPGIVTSEGTPHRFRAIGLLPPALLLAAIGLQAWLDALATRRRLVLAAAATAAVAIGGATASLAWRTLPATLAAFESTNASSAIAARQQAAPGTGFLVAGLAPDDAVTFRYLLWPGDPGIETDTDVTAPGGPGVQVVSGGFLTGAGTVLGSPDPGCGTPASPRIAIARPAGGPVRRVTVLSTPDGHLAPRGITSVGWELDPPPGTTFRPEIVLLDPSGRAIASREGAWVTAADGRVAGTTGLVTSPVLPRGDYRAGIRFRTPGGLLAPEGPVMGGTLQDGYLVPDPVCGPSAALDQSDGVRLVPPVEDRVVDGLRVASVRLPATVIRPGISLEPVLLVERTAVPARDGWLLVLRTSAGAEVAVPWTPLRGLPLTEWPRGVLLRDQPVLSLPAALPGSQARLLLRAPSGQEVVLLDLVLDQPDAASAAGASLPR